MAGVFGVGLTSRGGGPDTGHDPAAGGGGSLNNAGICGLRGDSRITVSQIVTWGIRVFGARRMAHLPRNPDGDREK
jgi:hypothetical protein